MQEQPRGNEIRSTPTARHAEGALGDYLRSIRALPVLEREDEIDLCLRAQAGDDMALARMARGNLKMVVRLARRYRRSTVSLEDLINEGNIGLVRAVRKYDPQYGLPFVPYAMWWVKQAMIMFLIQHGQGAISLPIRKVQLLKRLRREEDRLKTQLGRRPTTEELAARLNRDPQELRDLRRAIPEYVAFEEHLEDGGSPRPEELHPAEQAVDNRRLRGALEHLVDRLPCKDRDGVRLYFGLDGGAGMNYADLGRSLSMTREGARQMIKRSLRRLREDPTVGPLLSYL